VPCSLRHRQEALIGHPTEIIDRQLVAFNKRGIEAFVVCYGLEAKVVQPDGSFLASGRSEVHCMRWYPAWRIPGVDDG
jgi:hypothetical protein